ncbi:MAG: MOSC domain-containing protein [Sulfurovum sp.]|nr:MOSC domain-containing protein [Sulfurovum sp.]
MKVVNMVLVGTVSSLFYSPPIGRICVTSFDLDTQGILKDKHYNQNPSRSVLMTSLESYALAKHHGIAMDKGFLGENILIDYNPYHLSSGTRLQIGETILEITQPCTLCKSLSDIDVSLPLLLKDDRGIFAKVLVAGCIKEGDSLYLLET